MKKSLARQLVRLEVAASDATRELVSRVRALDVDQLRQVVGAGFIDRGRNVAA